MSRRAASVLFALAVAVPVLGQRPINSTPTVPTLSGIHGPTQPRVSADAELLTRLRIGTEPAALMELLRNHSRTDTDVARLEELVRRLGDEDYDRREKATREIIALGRPALGRLTKARDDDDPEIRRRAILCATEIVQSLNKDVALAAVRHLIAHPVPGVAEVLLAYLPEGDSEAEEAIFFGLESVALRDGKIDLALRTALTDAVAVRRAAAALVLGRRGTDEDRAAVRRCLTDPNSEVRLRAAQGLLAGRDAAALPVLVALLDQPSPDVAWQAEELLRWTAGRSAPAVALKLHEPKSARTCREAWTTWLNAHPNLDWDAVFRDHRRPGLLLLTHQDRVTLIGCDGQVRHTLTNVDGAMDAHLLPGGRFVVVEQSDVSRITQRDLRGEILWQHKSKRSEDYFGCQVLPNGNIFLCSDEGIGEITGKGEELYYFEIDEEMLLDAVRLRSGRILGATGPQLVEYDGTTIAPLRRVNILNARRGNAQTRVQTMPGGDFLVTQLNTNKVLHVGRDLELLWEVTVQRPIAATPLPNGNVIVSTMYRDQRTLELTREGATVWEARTNARIMRVRACLNLVRVGFDHPRPKDFNIDGIAYRIAMLKDSDLAERKRGADALGEFGPQAVSAIAPLMATLDDDDTDLRQRAGRALTRIGTIAVPALVRGLKEGTPRVREASAATLGEMQTVARDAVPELIAVLADEKQALTVRRSVAGALGNFRDGASVAVTELLVALKADDFELRAAAARSLGLISAEPAKVIPALIVALKDPTDAVKLEAAPALASFGPAAKDAVPLLVDIVKSTRKDELRQAAVQSLGTVGKDSKEAVAALTEVLKDAKQSNDARTAAVVALTQMKPAVKEVFPVFLAVFKDASTPSELSRTLAAHLGTYLPEESAPLLAQALRESGKPARLAIMSMMGNYGRGGKVDQPFPREIHAAIKEIAEKDTDETVKAQARRALQRLEGRPLTR